MSTLHEHGVFDADSQRWFSFLYLVRLSYERSSAHRPPIVHLSSAYLPPIVCLSSTHRPHIVRTLSTYRTKDLPHIVCNSSTHLYNIINPCTPHCPPTVCTLSAHCPHIRRSLSVYFLRTSSAHRQFPKHFPNFTLEIDFFHCSLRPF